MRLLKHSAEHFATNASRTGSAVGHHTLAGGDDGNTQATPDFWQFLGTGVITQSGTAGAADLFNDRLAFEILELNGQLGLDAVANLEIANITFALQHLRHGHLEGG